jgi:hypothetical protein
MPITIFIPLLIVPDIVPVSVYVDDVLSYPIVQQPADSPLWVSDNPHFITQFGLPTHFDVIGLLAHDYLAGKDFFELEIGQVAEIKFSDGHIKIFVISSISYESAGQPPSDIFEKYYMRAGTLVFQTCKDNGYLFVVADSVIR